MLQRTTVAALCAAAVVLGGCTHDPQLGRSQPAVSESRRTPPSTRPARTPITALRSSAARRAAITITAAPRPRIEALRINGVALDVGRIDAEQPFRVAAPGTLDRVEVKLDIDDGYEAVFYAHFLPGQRYVIRGNSCSWLVISAQGPTLEVVASPGRVGFRTAPTVGRTVWFEGNRGRIPVTAGAATVAVPWSNQDGVMCAGTPAEFAVYPTKGGRDSVARGRFAFLHRESVTVSYDGSGPLRFSLSTAP